MGTERFRRRLLEAFGEGGVVDQLTDVEVKEIAAWKAKELEEAEGKQLEAPIVRARPNAAGLVWPVPRRVRGITDLPDPVEEKIRQRLTQSQLVEIAKAGVDSPEAEEILPREMRESGIYREALRRVLRSMGLEVPTKVDNKKKEGPESPTGPRKRRD